MELFEAIENRRSVRRFTDKNIPAEVMKRSLESALLAPNSSNTQTWNFYWIQTPDIKTKVVKYCLSQSAARMAQELVVVSADPALWRRSQKGLIDFVQKAKAPKQVILYYEKLIPFVYSWGIFNSLAPIKWIMANFTGLFRPMVRGPNSKRDIQEIAIKSAALACENFVLAMTAQGYQTCMMEGFDESRIKRLLKMSRSERVVMVIACGEAAADGTWGPRYRIPSEQVIKII